jgi:hypothetical protein
MLVYPWQGASSCEETWSRILLLFIVAETHSGLKPLLWASWLIETLDLLDVVTGWVFQRDDSSPQRMGDFEEVIFDKLLQVQMERPDLIDPSIDVLEDFGLAQSFR